MPVVEMQESRYRTHEEIGEHRRAQIRGAQVPLGVH